MAIDEAALAVRLKRLAHSRQMPSWADIDAAADVLADHDAALREAIRERDEARAEVERLQADVAEAHDCIGRLQALVCNAEYWVSHGCSEKATEAMRQAMADGWSQMGWRDICRRREQLRKER